MRYLIVDDDPLMVDTLRHFAGKIDDLGEGDTCTNALEAVRLLRDGSYDLLLLDIDMPDMSGMDILRSLNPAIPVIMVTSKAEFVLASLEYNVIDYIVKPLDFARFYQAIQKVQRLAPPAQGADSDAGRGVIFIKDNRDLVSLELDRILYVEAASNYVSFVTANSSHTSYLSMKKVAEELPDYFVRIHRSYIVNSRKIDRIDQHDVIIGNKALALSPALKEQLLQKLHLLL